MEDADPAGHATRAAGCVRRPYGGIQDLRAMQTAVARAWSARAAGAPPTAVGFTRVLEVQVHARAL